MQTYFKQLVPSTVVLPRFDKCVLMYSEISLYTRLKAILLQLKMLGVLQKMPELMLSIRYCDRHPSTRILCLVQGERAVAVAESLRKLSMAEVRFIRTEVYGCAFVGHIHMSAVVLSQRCLKRDR